MGSQSKLPHDQSPLIYVQKGRMTITIQVSTSMDKEAADPKEGKRFEINKQIEGTEVVFLLQFFFRSSAI